MRTKIKKAYCPPAVVDKNPCVEYVRYVVLPWFGEFTVAATAPAAEGEAAAAAAPKRYTSYDPLEADYLVRPRARTRPRSRACSH